MSKSIKFKIKSDIKETKIENKLITRKGIHTTITWNYEKHVSKNDSIILKW